MEHLVSDNYFFSYMYILVRSIALFFVIEFCLFDTRIFGSVWSFMETHMQKAFAPLTAKWKYFRDFLTITDGKYTCELYVSNWGKHHISKTLTSYLSAADRGKPLQIIGVEYILAS